MPPSPGNTSDTRRNSVPPGHPAAGQAHNWTAGLTAGHVTFTTTLVWSPWGWRYHPEGAHSWAM